VDCDKLTTWNIQRCITSPAYFLLPFTWQTYGINVCLSDKTLKGRRRPDLLRSRLGISCWEKLWRCDSRELVPFLHCSCLVLAAYGYCSWCWIRM